MYKSGDTWYRDGDGRNVTDINDSIVSQWKNLNIDKTYSIGIGTSQLNEYMREISKSWWDVIVIMMKSISQTWRIQLQELLLKEMYLTMLLVGNGKLV